MKINLYKIIDKYFGIPLCFVIGMVSKLFPKEEIVPKRILIIKLWAIGDSVVSLPMIRALRQKFKDAEIDVLARKRNTDVFCNNSDITRIILFEPKNLFQVLNIFRQYDAVFDAEPYMRLSALLSIYAGRRRIGFGNQLRSVIYTDRVSFNRVQHMVYNYLDMANVLRAGYADDKLIKLNVGDKDKKAVESYLKDKKTGRNEFLIGVAPGVAESAKTRLWFNDRFAEVCDELINRYNAKIIFIGSKGEKDMIDNIQSLMRKNPVNTAGELTMQQVFYLISLCRIFISNDAGAMHIAAAQGVQTIGLFGPNTPDLWVPFGEGNIAIYHKVSCSPCIRNDKGYMPDCLRKNQRYLCMKLITVKDVLQAVEKVMV